MALPGDAEEEEEEEAEEEEEEDEEEEEEEEEGEAVEVAEETQTPDANATVSSLFKCGFWHHPATIEGPLTAHATPVPPPLPPPRSLPGPPGGGLLNAIPAAGLVNATVLLDVAGSGLEKVDEPEDAGGVAGDGVAGDGTDDSKPEGSDDSVAPYVPTACVAPAASADFPSPAAVGGLPKRQEGPPRPPSPLVHEEKSRAAGLCPGLSGERSPLRVSSGGWAPCMAAVRSGHSPAFV